METQLLKAVGQPRTLDQELHGMAARRIHALHPRFGLQPCTRCVARDQATSQHHARIGCRGAAGHRRDGDGSALQLIAIAAQLDGNRLVAIDAALGADRTEARLCGSAVETVVRTRRTRHGRLDGRQVDLDDVGIRALVSSRVVPRPLSLSVRLNQCDLLGAPPRDAQVIKRLIVNREQRAGASVFGRHVRDACALRGAQAGKAGAEALDETADDALLAKRLRKSKGDVHGGASFGKRAYQTDADHLRDKRGDRLTQSRSLGFDTADAPAQNADAVCRWRVAVGADQRIEIHKRKAAQFAVNLLTYRAFGSFGSIDNRTVRVADHCDLCELLDVQLMADTNSGRHDAHVLERTLRPLQEAIALVVALEFKRHVVGQGRRATELVGDDGMIDDQIAWNLRVDLGRIAA